MKSTCKTLLLALSLVLGIIVASCSDDGPSDGSGIGPDSGDVDVNIVTGGADPMAFRATLHGKIRGGEVPDEVGFEYCYNRNFRDGETGRVSRGGLLGEYELEAAGIVDQMKVYYRAYAIVGDDIRYGRIAEFETPQGTYTIDGKTFKFIKVEGGPTGSFSMMQTELPFNAVFEIDGREIGKIDVNGDGEVTKGEVRAFLVSTDILMRAPTVAEWKFAASGGFNSQSYMYSGSDDLNSVGWYAENSEGSQRRPAQKKPNELGFYDMSGNYAEFCAIYEDVVLSDIRRKVNNCTYSIKNLSADVFNTTWSAAAGAYGGRWDSQALKCTMNSTEFNANPYNKYDGKRYTFRFLYDRPTIGEDGGETGDTGEFLIVTGAAKPNAYSAVLEGRVTGPKVPNVVGFEYSYSEEFKKDNTMTVSENSIGGTFRLTTNVRLVDLAKVYYRAFAVVDGEKIYGDIRSFETLQGTYTLNGKTYKFIKVTGLPTGSFSMMQTEFPPSAIIEIDGYEFGPYDIDGNGEVSKGELREAWSSKALEGLAFRAPTAKEWKFAASGGLNSHGYKFSGSDTAEDVAWFSYNSNGNPREPALKIPNELGFYDMSGNYAELCARYNDDQLFDLANKVRRFEIRSIKDMPAEISNLAWAAEDGAYGGNWNSDVFRCQIESSISVNNSTNKFNGRYYTYRIVYSRPD